MPVARDCSLVRARSDMFFREGDFMTLVHLCVNTCFLSSSSLIIKLLFNCGTNEIILTLP